MNNKELNTIAKNIFGYCSMGVAAELPEKEHIAYLTDAIKTLPDECDGEIPLSLYLETAFTKRIEAASSTVQIEHHNNDMCDYGTKYEDIAAFILCHVSDMGIVMQYDDQTHINIIVNQLKHASKYLVYYLADATENENV